MTEVKKPVRRRRAAPAGIAPNEPERDILDQYLYEVSTYPLLKGTEEIDLAKKIRAGDQDALQELVKRNLRFVISVAKKYQNRGLPLIDLIGEGNVGLLTVEGNDFRFYGVQQLLEVNHACGAKSTAHDQARLEQAYG
jgi:RNA polymerase primary sigma factor